MKKNILTFGEMIQLKSEFVEYFQQYGVSVTGKWSEYGVLTLTCTGTNVDKKVGQLLEAGIKKLSTMGKTFYDYYFPYTVLSNNSVQFRAELSARGHVVLEDEHILFLTQSLYRYFKKLYGNNSEFPESLQMIGYDNHCEISPLVNYTYSTGEVTPIHNLVKSHGDLNLIQDYCNKLLKKLSALPYSLASIDLKMRDRHASHFVLDVGEPEGYYLLSDVPKKAVKDLF